MTFKIGDKVLRTANDWGGAVKGQEYTVSFTLTGTGLRLEGYGETIFSSRGFELVTPAVVPHKHAALIKAWADGAKVQYLWEKTWHDSPAPTWDDRTQYRIKPEPKPDNVQIARVQYNNGHVEWRNLFDTEIGGKVEFTFDGETGKLKSVEVVPSGDS
jgi:hypothetical protein